MEARVWNSESDGQQSDEEVQRQFCVDADANPRAVVRRKVRRRMAVQGVLHQRVGRTLYTSATLNSSFLSLYLSLLQEKLGIRTNPRLIEVMPPSCRSSIREHTGAGEKL